MSLIDFANKHFPAYTGLFSTEQRAKNLGTFEEYVDRIVGEDGINKVTGRDREYYLNHEPTQNAWMKQANLRLDSLKASKFSDESAYSRFAKGSTSAITDLGAFIAGGLSPKHTIDELSEKWRPKFKVNEQALEQYLGYPPTEKEKEEWENFIYQKGDASALGYGLGVAADISQ